MNIIVSVGGDNSVAMTDDQLARLNVILSETPLVNRYDNDKFQEKKRMRLEATMVVKTKQYDVL